MAQGYYKRPLDDMTYQEGGKRLKTGNARDKRKQFIDDMYDRVSLDAEDKKKSRAYVDQILGDIIGHVRKQDYGHIYGHQIIKAGSYPINAKIGKADEFDTNILLNLEPQHVHRSGLVKYMIMEVSNQGAQSSVSTDFKLFRTNGTNIPNGYAVVEVKKSGTPSNFIHNADLYSQFQQQQSATSPNFRTFHTTQSNLLYGGPYYQQNLYPPASASYLSAGAPSYSIHREVTDTVVINKGTQPGCIDLVARDVKQDLHQRIKRAKHELGLQDVSISNTSQGPALTLTISPKREAGINHAISVDITASLKCATKLKLEDFGWPRPQTRKAFDKDIIDAAIESGIHLVPKKDLFWSISFSRAEKAVLSSIDRRFGCRKRVLKLLKKYVAKCKFGSRSKLPGISSHILKTQILWSCEIHADETMDYWNYDNRDECLMETMEELEKSLRRRDLPEYFNMSINVLARKDPVVLDELANFLNSERVQLTNLGGMI